MTIKNPWVGYATRGYEQIRLSVINALRTKAPEIKDYSESNLLIILVSIFAGVAEMLNFYIDQMAREAFISTTRLYSSMVKHTRLLDYRIKTSLASSVNLTLTATVGGNPTPTNVQHIIKAGHSFQSDNGIIFINREDFIWPLGVASVTLPVEQLSFYQNQTLGTTNGDANQAILIPEDYAYNTMKITIALDEWFLVDTLGRSKPEDRHFIIDVNTNRQPYLQFGDGMFGAIPLNGTPIIGTYYTTRGAEGQVGPGSINIALPPINIPGITQVTVINPGASSGGQGIQNLEQIRRSLPLSLRTLDRAVTRQDYIDIAKLYPGVNKAALHFDCGKEVEIYISPVGGGIAQKPLLDAVYNHIYERKMVTTKVLVYPAGESKIVIEAEIWAKFRKDKTQTYNAVTAALLNAYSINNSDINKYVRLSDVIATIDNVPEVDYIKLNKLAIKPFPRPVAHNNLLDWDIKIVNPSIQTTWMLEFSVAGIRLFKNNSFIGTFGINQWYTDPDQQLDFKINPGPYVIGNRWTFSTYPQNLDQPINDYSMPLAEIQNLNLKVNEQLVAN